MCTASWESWSGLPVAWRGAPAAPRRRLPLLWLGDRVSLSLPLTFALPLPVSPLFCSTCKGPGQQGREAKAEGDHRRLWGVRVRGAFSALRLRIQEPLAQEPAPEGVPFSRGLCHGPSWGQPGAVPLQAWPGLPLARSQVCLWAQDPALAPPSLLWTAVHGLSRPSLPGPLLGPPVWLLTFLLVK